MGHSHPENVIDNQFLETLEIGTSDQWIMERVGIRRRRTSLPLDYILKTRNTNPAELPHEAIRNTIKPGWTKAVDLALERSNLKRSDIGMVIAGGCSPQFSIPADACLIASELGLTVPAFDINSACSSFAIQLNFLRSMKAEATPDYILIVNSEYNTRTVNYTDRTTAVLWGDGTSASIVSLKKPLTNAKAKVRVTFTTIASDPAGWNKVVIPMGGHFTQVGSAVQAFAIKKTLATLDILREQLVQASGQFYFIGHQANLLMLEAVCRRASIPEERHIFNVNEFGNCGAAGAPIVFSQNWDRFKAGDEIAMVVVGSGLTWGGILFQVEDLIVEGLK